MKKYMILNTLYLILSTFDRREEKIYHRNWVANNQNDSQADVR